MQAWDEERDFRALVAADPQIADRLGADGIESAFDLAATVAHVDTVFDRLHALVAKREETLSV
jgi:adenylosuccinate lyase